MVSNSGLTTIKKCNFSCLARIIWKSIKITILGVLLLIQTETIFVESFRVFVLFWCFQDTPSTKLAKWWIFQSKGLLRGNRNLGQRCLPDLLYTSLLWLLYNPGNCCSCQRKNSRIGHTFLMPTRQLKKMKPENKEKIWINISPVMMAGTNNLQHIFY